MEIVSGLKLKHIFLDNNNWWHFFINHHNLRPAIVINVLKMLICRTSLFGFHQYLCPHCHCTKKAPHSCKSRFCSSCGKKATDQWIRNNMDALPDTTWQHITFTMPDQLWPLFWLNRHLFQSISSIGANIIKSIALKNHLIPGIYTAIHTFGRDLKRNAHLHLSVTRGGLYADTLNQWRKAIFFHHKVVKPQWKYGIIHLFRTQYKNGNLVLPSFLSHLNNYSAFNSWLNMLYQKNRVVHFNKPSNNKKHSIHYLGKYLKRPPIGETRIKSYDGKSVVFEYLDHYSNSKMLKSLPVDDFIGRLVSHIHDTHFRCIRYYGFLANRVRGTLLPVVHKLLKNPFFNELYQKVKISWQQLIIQTFGVDPLICKNCGKTMFLNSVVFPQKFSLLPLHQQIACQPI